MPASRFLFSALTPLLLALPGWANDPSWPGWRGAGRDNQVADFKLPGELPEKLEPIWRVEVGSGYATPVVAGERIYQHARQGGDEVLWCLELASGESVWRSTLPVDFTPGRGGEGHGRGPKSTPAIADGRVATLSITGLLAGWDADDGSLLWKRDFRERFEPAHPYWGTATSPLMADGRLFAHTGSCEDGALFCLDPATGEDVWVQDEHANCYSSPLIETVDGVRQFIELNHAGLSGIDLKTGEVLWTYAFPHRGNKQNTPTPVFHDGVFVIGGEDRGLRGLRPRRGDDGWSVELLWRHRDASLDMSSPVVNDGLVYGFSQFKLGQFFCLEPSTGKVVWTGEPRMGENAQFLSLPGHVLALTDRGELHVLRAGGGSTKVLRTYQVADSETWGAPALVDGSLLVKERDHLIRLRLPEP